MLNDYLEAIQATRTRLVQRAVETLTDPLNDWYNKKRRLCMKTTARETERMKCEAMIAGGILDGLRSIGIPLLEWNGYRGPIVQLYRELGNFGLSSMFLSGDFPASHSLLHCIRPIRNQQLPCQSISLEAPLDDGHENHLREQAKKSGLSYSAPDSQQPPLKKQKY